MGTAERTEDAGRLTVHWMPLLRYQEGMDFQQRCFDEVYAADGAVAHLIFAEHTPVITLGRSSSREHVLTGEEELARRQVEVHETNRGGDVTFHGPGQLVAYPIMSLSRLERDLHRYLRRLEQWLIDICAHWGIEAGRRDSMTGVWVDDRKIAAIGIACRNWITYHGVALNVTTDLAWFDLIVPCGIHDYGVTSLARELDRAVSLDDVRQVALGEFIDQFEMEGWSREWA